MRCYERTARSLSLPMLMSLLLHTQYTANELNCYRCCVCAWSHSKRTHRRVRRVCRAHVISIDCMDGGSHVGWQGGSVEWGRVDFLVRRKSPKIIEFVKFQSFFGVALFVGSPLYCMGEWTLATAAAIHHFDVACERCRGIRIHWHISWTCSECMWVCVWGGGGAIEMRRKYVFPAKWAKEWHQIESTYMCDRRIHSTA